MREVNCAVLNRVGEGLNSPPYPGPIGQRIYETVSKEAWDSWLQRLVLIINENRLSTADPEHVLQAMVEGTLILVVLPLNASSSVISRLYLTSPPRLSKPPPWRLPRNSPNKSSNTSAKEDPKP